MGFWNLFKNKEQKREEDYTLNEEMERNEEEVEVEEYVEHTDYESYEDFSKDNEEEALINEGSIVEAICSYDRELTEEEVDELITNEIIKVVQGYGSFDELKTSSEAAVKAIGDKYVDLLPGYISSKVSRPRELRERYDALGEWQMVVENAVLMILFSYKEKGVKHIVKILYSNKNLRLKCINLLCKLAAENILTEDIVNTIMNNLPYFDDDEKITIFGFMSQIKGNNQVIALTQHFYKKFVKEKDIVRGYETLVHLVNVAGKYTKGHLNFLKLVALGKSAINLEEIMGIDEEDEKIIFIGDIEEIYRVRAAITYYGLEKEDDDINSKLYYWSEYSLDKNVRRETKEILNHN